MSIKWSGKDPRGFKVLLYNDRWEHIISGHQEFEHHIEWCMIAVEQPIEIRTHQYRPDDEIYVGPPIASGFLATGPYPTVAVKIVGNDTRVIKTAYTGHGGRGTIVWTPPAPDDEDDS